MSSTLEIDADNETRLMVNCPPGGVHLLPGVFNVDPSVVPLRSAAEPNRWLLTMDDPEATNELYWTLGNRAQPLAAI